MQSKPCRTMKKNKTKQNTDTVEEKELHCYAIQERNKTECCTVKSKLKFYFLFWSNSNVRSIYELRSG